MINIILMAGHGQRFKDQGYETSKPLLPVSGKPMILKAVVTMPQSKRWVFVVRSEHLQEPQLISNLKSVAPDVKIVVDPSPSGQLKSCLVAQDHFINEEDVFIGACDAGLVHNQKQYLDLIRPSNSLRPDVIAWSFTRQPNLSRNPSAWGWLRVAEDCRVKGVSVKVPISSDPYHDYAVTGSFTFRSGQDFVKIATELMRRNLKVKNEFYIDSMVGLAVDLGYRVFHFPVLKYLSWGTPEDYEEYRYWDEAFRNPASHPEAKNKLEYEFWAEYFSGPPIS